MEGKQIITRANRNEIDSYEKSITEVHSLTKFKGAREKSVSSPRRGNI